MWPEAWATEPSLKRELIPVTSVSEQERSAERKKSSTTFGGKSCETAIAAEGEELGDDADVFKPNVEHDFIMVGFAT